MQQVFNSFSAWGLITAALTPSIEMPLTARACYYSHCSLFTVSQPYSMLRNFCGYELCNQVTYELTVCKEWNIPAFHYRHININHLENET
jgi:hypothetical protein